MSVKVQEQALIRTRWHGQWKIPDRYVAVRFTSVFLGVLVLHWGFFLASPSPLESTSLTASKRRGSVVFRGRGRESGSEVEVRGLGLEVGLGLR